MPRAKISVAIRALSMDLKNAIEAVMQMGATGVQFDLRNELPASEYGDSARRQLLHFLNERGLQIATGHFPLRGPLTTPDRLQERLTAIRNAMEFAAKLKIRMLTLRAGRLPAEDDADARGTMQSIISELAGRGNQCGVTLCLIPCGESAADLRSFVESIKTGAVSIDADLGGWALNRQAIVPQLRDLHDLIEHFEIRDAVRDMDGRGREVVVGRGEIDWDEVAALIVEMGFSGWLNVDRTEGADCPGDVAKAVKFLKNLLPVE